MNNFNIGIKDKENNEVKVNHIVEYEWSTCKSNNKSICLVVYDNFEKKFKMEVIGEDKNAQEFNSKRGFDFTMVSSSQLKL